MEKYFYTVKTAKKTIKKTVKAATMGAALTHILTYDIAPNNEEIESADRINIVIDRDR